MKRLLLGLLLVGLLLAPSPVRAIGTGVPGGGVVVGIRHISNTHLNFYVIAWPDGQESVIGPF